MNYSFFLHTAINGKFDAYQAKDYLLLLLIVLPSNFFYYMAMSTIKISRIYYSIEESVFERQ